MHGQTDIKFFQIAEFLNETSKKETIQIERNQKYILKL